MKVLPVALLLAAALPSLALVAATRTPSPSSSPLSSPQSSPSAIDRSITVSGEAVLNVVPDIARFQLLIDEANVDRAKATADSDADVARVLKVLAAHGIAAADITTQAPSFTPQYRLDRFGQPLYLQVIGWQVTRTITVCSHKLDDIGSLQRDAYAAGARPDGDITFDTSKLAELRIEVRRLAAQAARAKATALVGELGGELGLPRHIDEQNNGWSPPTYKNVLDERLEGAVAAADFSAGKMSLTSTVNVVFDING